MECGGKELRKQSLIEASREGETRGFGDGLIRVVYSVKNR